MAELNFGLLNPPGSQSIGNAFVTGMDQAAAARAQENQNALSQYTLSKARREDEMQNQLYDAVRQPGFKLDIGTAMRFGAPGLAAYKAQQEANKNAVDIAYTQARTNAIPGTIAKTDAETSKLKGEARFKAMGEVASFPNADAAHAAIDARFASGAIDQAAADEMRSGLTPDNFDKWQLATLKRLSTPADQLRQGAVTYKDTDTGGTISRQKYDAQGNAIGDPVIINKTITPSTAATLKQAQDHYNGLSEFQKQTLAQNGWTFDSERGVAVNARRGISQPISTLMSPVGGGGVPAAPSGVAAPAVPGVAGGGVPGQRQAPAGQPAAVAGVLGPKPADVQKTEIELNKQYASESKGFTETKLAIDKAKAALKDAATNPTAGLSAGTAFMKILDPQSVVRETELAMALKSSGWFDRATNIANTLQSGKTILTPTQITNLNKTIDGLFEEVKAEQRIVDSGYARRARSYGLDVGNIITDRGQNKIGTTEKTLPNAPPIQSFRRP